MALVVVVKM